jgi:hypothetical protein
MNLLPATLLNPMKISLAACAAAALSITIALADDIKTNTGQEYKDATISRAEPDGLVIMFSAGIVKIPFTELSPDLQKKYGYNPQAAAQFRAQVDRAAAERDAAVAAAKERQRQFNLSGLTPTPAGSAPPRHSLTLSRIAPSGSVTLARVFSDYDKNQLSADGQYKGATFTMGGTVKAVTSEDDAPWSRWKSPAKTPAGPTPIFCPLKPERFSNFARAIA